MRGRASPASTTSVMSGSRSRSSFSASRLVIPFALPIGAAHGITTLQPASTSRIATESSSVQ